MTSSPLASSPLTLSAIEKMIWATPFLDTHEHLIEEARRIAGPTPGDRLLPCDDWAYLFHHYVQNDIEVAGMTPAEAKRFFSPELTPRRNGSCLRPIGRVSAIAAMGEPYC